MIEAQKDGMTHCHGYNCFSFLKKKKKKNEATFKRKHFSFAEEKYLESSVALRTNIYFGCIS